MKAVPIRLALLALSWACSTSAPPCPQWPKPVPIATEMGESCNLAEFACAAGLTCLYAFNGNLSSAICTVDCSDAGCPAGSVCLPSTGKDRDSDPVPAAVCVASCERDSDCWKTTIRRCSPYFDAGICIGGLDCAPPEYSGEARSCNFSDCPSGYACLGFGDPLCCDGVKRCRVCQPGWCERQ